MNCMSFSQSKRNQAAFCHMVAEWVSVRLEPQNNTEVCTLYNSRSGTTTMNAQQQARKMAGVRRKLRLHG